MNKSMALVTVALALFAVEANATCGPNIQIWGSTEAGSTNTTTGDRYMPGIGIPDHDTGYTRNRNRGNSFGLTLNIPLTSHSCDNVKAQSAMYSSEVRKNNELSRKQRLDNLKTIVGICSKMSHLEICTEIESIAAEIY